MLNTVKTPKQFETIFQRAQDFVSKYFKNRKEDPTKGTIEIFGERYILMRAASMSVEFFETIKELYRDQGEQKAVDVAMRLLFDIAHAIGKQDAKNFHGKMNLKDPIEKLSVGPVHFSYSGWAFVDILPESKPSPDENYYLIYDHPYSFESDAWLKAGKKPEFSVCVMNAGYSSGWCEESFGIPLVASEIMCRTKGDAVCRFIMAHPSKIEYFIKEYIKKEPHLAPRITKYEIPGFFKTKEIEEKLRQAKDFTDSLVQTAQAIILVLDMEGRITFFNPYMEEISGYKLEDAKGKDWFTTFLPPHDRNNIIKLFSKALSDIPTRGHINLLVTKDGKQRHIEWYGRTLKDIGGNDIGLLAVGQDITDRKRADDVSQILSQQWQVTFDGIKDAISIIDTEGKILQCNKAMVEFIHKPAGEIVGHKCWELVHGTQSPIEGCPFLRVHKSLKRETADFEIGKRWVSVTVDPIIGKDGRLDSIVHVISDITERKKMETESRKRLSDLEVFYKASSGREKRILELKRTIKELEEKLNKGRAE